MHKLGGVLVAAVLCVSLLPASVLAQTGQTNPATPAVDDALNKRIADRKTALKTRLTTTQQRNITNKCKAAQTVLTNLKTRTQTGLNKRLEVYNKLGTKLDEMVVKLESASVSATELKAVAAQYDTKVDKFKNDLTAYNQSLSDLTAMNCASDPTGFKAMLETLRSQRTQLGKDAADIRSHMPQISKALSSARLLLANKTQTTGGSN